MALTMRSRADYILAPLRILNRPKPILKSGISISIEGLQARLCLVSPLVALNSPVWDLRQGGPIICFSLWNPVSVTENVQRQGFAPIEGFD